MPGELVLVIDDSPTILKVVEMVLGRAGYRVRTASGGAEGIEAARDERPALVLLDFVMPGVNGYQVCVSFAAEEKLRGVPVVLMSAKADEVGERFVRVTGIAGYITKPFSPEAITALVRRLLAPPVPPADADDEESVLEDTSPGASAQPILAYAAALDGVRAEQERRRAEQIIGLRADLVSLLGDEQGGCRDKLTDEALGRLLDRLAGRPRPAEVVLEGAIDLVPLPEVLQLLAEQRHSGNLLVDSADAEIAVQLRDGRIQFVAGRGLPEEFLLGHYLVRLGALSLEALARYLEDRGPVTPAPQMPDGPLTIDVDRLMGADLVRLGLLSEDDLREALRRQSSERLYEALRWRTGRFSFHATRALGPLAERAALDIPIEHALLEGLHRAEEWHLVSRQVDDLDAIFLRNEAAIAELERVHLSREEMTLLELVNGKNSVKDVQRESRMSSFEVARVLARLLSIRLIRRRVSPVAV